jgi:phage repressor protein C with HTH and peptisase S24 domain
MASENNIQLFREQRGWSRPELGKRMGTSGQQVERLEKGQRRLAQEWIDRAADALEVEPSSIIARVANSDVGLEVIQPDNKPTHTVDAGEVVDMISVDLSLSMGPGTVIEEYPEEEPIKFDLALLRSITRTPPSRLRLIKGIGESMMPTLQTGDRIMVDLNERAYSRIDGIYWVNHFGAHGIKRLRAIGRGRMLIVSDNPAVENQEVDAEDLLIHGRAIWVAREL